MSHCFFIAGATGYTGREIARLAATQSIETLAHVRPNSPRRVHWTEQFEHWGATATTVAWEPTALEETFRATPPSHIFATLGTTKARTKREQKSGNIITGYEGVDYGLTKMAYEAATTLDHPPIFIYLSSLGVDAPKRNAYLDARYRIEQQIHQGPLPYIIFRPAFITGPNRDEFRLIERAGAVVSDALFTGLAGLGVKSPKTKWGSINNTNLAKAMLKAALDPGALNTTISSHQIQAILG